jgi:hypothetical protein
MARGLEITLAHRVVHQVDGRRVHSAARSGRAAAAIEGAGGRERSERREVSRGRARGVLSCDEMCPLRLSLGRLSPPGAP